MAGFCIGENDKIRVKPYRNGGNTDQVNVKDLEPRLDIDVLLEILPDIVPALLERRIPHENFIIHRLYTAAHGVTSSIAFLSGMGL